MRLYILKLAKQIFKRIFFVCLGILFLLKTSCVEEFVPENITFENLLVVEATLTDEFKFQRIKLSRTFKFDEEQLFESEADVTVSDNLGNIYWFNEIQPGNYQSINQFAIEPSKNYLLNIRTRDNSSYSSSPVSLPSNTAEIIDVGYVKSTNSVGEEGIEIFVDSFDPLNSSTYYRFEFEETYKIVAPLWAPLDAIVISKTPPAVGTQPRINEEQVCYNTISNTNIIQTETNNLSEDRITQFPLKFISKESPVLRSRYSIIVKQFAQTLEAYTFYKTLNEFSNSESVFSENQPGFLVGNIFSDSNANNKVLGFFEVASLKSKRIYLNYEDLYPDEGRAPYFIDCDLFAPLLVVGDGSNSPLIRAIESNILKFIDFNLQPTETRPGPFLMTQRECGDCTVYGSNIKPDFWID